MFITVNQNALTITPGTEIIVQHQTWEDYEKLLEVRQQKTIPKIYFNGKSKQI